MTPGSESARRIGCTCPVGDNHHGEGQPRPERRVFIVRLTCPLHTVYDVPRVFEDEEVKEQTVVTDAGWQHRYRSTSVADASVSPPLYLEDYVEDQRSWSADTFGPGPRTASLTAHIRKELLEIEAAPSDLEEWIDVVILALDGAWRTGASPEDIAEMLARKQAKNRARTWPDWRTHPEGAPTEHVRTPEEGA